MIGYFTLPLQAAKVLLVVAPLMTDQPRVPLDTLLAAGYEMKSAVGTKDIQLFLQKGTELYGCRVPAEVLAAENEPAGEIPVHQILCAPFR